MERKMKNDPLAKRVGQAIARQRRLAKMTQQIVAENLKIEPETVSRLETGSIPASLLRLEQLGELFCCPVIRFFQDEDIDRESSESSESLRVLTDILLSLNSEEKTLVVEFVSDVARLLKKLKKNL
jgi:transcriptional regulator with XRE-family HTH domain